MWKVTNDGQKSRAAKDRYLTWEGLGFPLLFPHLQLQPLIWLRNKIPQKIPWTTGCSPKVMFGRTWSEPNRHELKETMISVSR